MNTSKVCCYLLLAGVLLVGASCKRHEIATSNLHTLTIVACVPDTDPLTIHSGDQVQWNSGDGNQYAIAFDPKTIPGSPPIVVTLPGLSVPANGNYKAPVSGPSSCSTVGCYYKYNISQGGTVCNDPGIRIVPGSSPLRGDR